MSSIATKNWVKDLLKKLRQKGGLTTGNGTPVTIDSELSDTSENPVQNKVISNALKNVSGSTITVDSELSDTSENPVQNKVINNAFKSISDHLSVIHPSKLALNHLPNVLYKYEIVNNITPVTGLSENPNDGKTYYEKRTNFISMPYVDFVYDEDTINDATKTYYLIDPITSLESDKEYYVFYMDADGGGGSFKKVEDNTNIPTKNDGSGKKHTIFYKRVGDIFDPWSMIFLYIDSAYNNLRDYLKYSSESYFETFNGIYVFDRTLSDDGDFNKDLLIGGYFLIIGDNHDGYLVGPGSISYNDLTDKPTIPRYITAGQKSGTTLGGKATAEGYNTTASGSYSHAEGYNTTASGSYSHAEGAGTTASGSFSHAEGSGTTASGPYSHAEGSDTTATGNHSHAGGYNSQALHNNSFVHGTGLVTTVNGQVIVGSYNEYRASNFDNVIFCVGNGTSDSNRLNALEVFKDGTVVIGFSNKITGTTTYNRTITQIV